ncbi:MAG: Crp/Fnr family transcriptional regulator [Clostridiales bacterium]|nr:Crp/Fnr family transcriptional regulator [Clostridiales bacterium]
MQSQKKCITIVPIFNHLEEDQMMEIMDATTQSSYKKGSLIYRDGDEVASLFIVRKGKIRIYKISESGKEQLVRILLPGDYTGELAVFGKMYQTSYAEAISDTEICMITKEKLQDFLIKYPTISLKILAEFSNRLNESEKQTTRFATEKVETRIAFFLAELIEDPNLSLEVELPMSKKDVASYLGTTPETLSRKLADLEEKGLILQKTSKRIEIMDIDELLLV